MVWQLGGGDPGTETLNEAVPTTGGEYSTVQIFQFSHPVRPQNIVFECVQVGAIPARNYYIVFEMGVYCGPENTKRVRVHADIIF